MNPLPDSRNLVSCACDWEKNTPDRVYLVQPMGGGDANIRTWTWHEAVGEARCMATRLIGMDLPPRSHIALCSKNCAHWIMADLAIWMAGHISVPIFPVLTTDIVRYILEHAEAKLLFVGKLDPIWEEMKKGVPEELPCISFPLAPEDGNGCETWDDCIAGNAPLDETAACPADQTATIVYTSGSTGTPKGVMLGFGAMYRSAKGISEHLGFCNLDRALSYLPLAHVFERWLFESCSFYSGLQLFFAESLDTFLQDLQRGPTHPVPFGSPIVAEISAGCVPKNPARQAGPPVENSDPEGARQKENSQAAGAGPGSNGGVRQCAAVQRRHPMVP